MWKFFSKADDYCTTILGDIERIIERIKEETIGVDPELFISDDVKKIYEKLLKGEFRRKSCELSLSHYKKIREELENVIERLNLEEKLTDPHGWFNSKWNVALNIFLLILSLYAVLGGMWVKYGGLKFILYLFLLIILLSLVWLYEGLQMSLGQIRLLNKANLKKYPRLYKIHKKISDEEGMNIFLSGRQLLVVILVFFIAQLTSISDLRHFPFFRVNIPSWFNNTFGFIFWKLGVGGAFVTLWFAQLFSQRVAVKQYLKFSNLPIIPFSFRIANFFSILTLPSKWIENLFIRDDEDNSQFECSDIHIYKVLRNKSPFEIQTFKREWIIEERKGRFAEILRTTYMIKVNEDLDGIVVRGSGIDQASNEEFKDGGFLIISGDKQGRLSFRENEGSRIVVEGESLIVPNFFREKIYFLRPCQGYFKKGSIIMYEIKYKVPVKLDDKRYYNDNFVSYLIGGDVVEILTPTKNFVFIVKLMNENIPFSGVSLTIKEGTKILEAQRKLEEHTIRNGKTYFYYKCCINPSDLRRFIFSWKYF